ncbi:MAG: GNAT family N-acetyltransferase [Pirellulales bacterium]|nr:GNAT family N-acetyltransferase [Pirellulales bacterium]
MSKLEVIRAKVAYLDGLSELFDGYRRYYQQESNLAAAREFLTERLHNDESVIFLALSEGKPIGFTQLYPSFSSVSMRRIWILNDLFVAEDARRSGAGGALMETARRHAEETNAKGLVLATAHDNLAAQSLYERLGWKRDQEFLHYELLV